MADGRWQMAKLGGNSGRGDELEAHLKKGSFIIRI